MRNSLAHAGLFIQLVGAHLALDFPQQLDQQQMALEL
jgi:hypothetical protein